jgi:hypothetical protein
MNNERVSSGRAISRTNSPDDSIKETSDLILNLANNRFWGDLREERAHAVVLCTTESTLPGARRAHPLPVKEMMTVPELDRKSTKKK